MQSDAAGEKGEPHPPSVIHAANTEPNNYPADQNGENLQNFHVV